MSLNFDIMIYELYLQVLPTGTADILLALVLVNWFYYALILLQSARVLFTKWNLYLLFPKLNYNLKIFPPMKQYLAVY